MHARTNVSFAILFTAASWAPSLAHAQPRETEGVETSSVPVNIGFVPYVDVNSHFAMPENHMTLDVLVGSTFGLEGLGIAGLAGLAWGDARGLQIGGVSSYAGGDLVGAQIGSVVGIVGGTATGIQVAGVANVAGAFTGAQIGGVVNVAPDGGAGVQVAGAVNVAGDLAGAQIGIVNVGGHVRGAQIGIVNVAEEVDGATVGLVNVVLKNGRHGFDVATSGTAALSFGAKLGTRYVYSVLGMGLQLVEGRSYWMPTAGLGGSIPILEDGFVNIELLASATNEGSEFDRESVLGQLRVVGGYRVTEGIALYAGPVLVSYRSASGKRLSDISYVPTLATSQRGGTTQDLGLGYVVGVELL
ncbi:MAG: hypothetical protein IT373_27275 [Polyangiaceae bacterium]|nr:hypothetical protein [Polyangiaceae bacterium]